MSARMNVGQIAPEYELFGDIRGRGLFLGLEFVADRASKKPFPAEDKLD